MLRNASPSISDGLASDPIVPTGAAGLLIVSVPIIGDGGGSSRRVVTPTSVGGERVDGDALRDLRAQPDFVDAPAKIVHI